MFLKIQLVILLVYSLISANDESVDNHQSLQYNGEDTPQDLAPTEIYSEMFDSSDDEMILSDTEEEWVDAMDLDSGNGAVSGVKDSEPYSKSNGSDSTPRLDSPFI